jgi:tetratricopeptide (TPR) repeat protein
MPRTPIVHPISWLSVSINIGVLGLFILSGGYLAQANGVFLGTATYLVISRMLRRKICRHHRNAIGHCKSQEYELAIPDFQKSLEFFHRHQWVDKFGAITMLSISGMGYREMALVSIGFCYGQIGDGKNARLHYEQCLKQFPTSGMAEAALRLMDAARETTNA